MLFNSSFSFGAKLPDFTEDQVKNEPMLFSCDTAYARKVGGPITQAFLDALHEDGYLKHDMIFDTRVHMLMPGWYPAIPGWHHDDVPRDPKNRGQPNYVNPSYFAQHCLALVNGNIAPTNMLSGPVRVSDPDLIPFDENVYEVWDAEINKKFKNSLMGDHVLDYVGGRWQELRVVPAPSNRLVYFDADTFHEGVKAVAHGWRWFGRVSWDTEREVKNEIRRQVQVYLEFPKKGW